MRVFPQVVGVFGRAWVWAALLIGAGACAEAATDETADVPSKRPKVAEVPPKPAPLRVSVFLEYSGGMRGFVPAGNAATAATEFQRRVGSLLTETEVSPDVTGRNYFLVYKDTDLRATPFTKMRDVVEGRQAEAALGTELPDMLGAILKRSQAASEVSVIISDFIYGPEVASRIPLIADYIRTAVAPVTRAGLAVAVLAEPSAFVTGKTIEGKQNYYYPAVKTPTRHRQLRGEKIPYYIWVVGPPALVSRYLKQVAKSLPPTQAYFGLRYPAVRYGAVLAGLPPGSKLGTSGDGSVWLTGSKDPTNLEVEDVAKTVEFTVGLDLSQLPIAWQQPAWLGQRLQASLPGTAPRIVPGSVQQLTAAQRAASAPLAPYTHVLRLRLNALPDGPSTLTLALPAPETPAWVAQWSTDNDNLPGPVPHTYRLTDIMSGLRGAFPAALPPVFAVRFALANQD